MGKEVRDWVLAQAGGKGGERSEGGSDAGGPRIFSAEATEE